MSEPPSDAGPSFSGIVLRIVLLLAFVLLATWVSHLVREAMNLQVMPENEQRVHRAIMLGAVAYVALLALPFVPGAEIGIAMLTAFGAAIAPLVYAATVLAMLLDGAPPRTVALALRQRYAALALAVNIPGNAIIGGGGGIMMMAGLSGLFAPLPTLVTVAIAVSPIPLAVILFGATGL